MKTVYVVTCGTYSDYSICAVFSNKELAEDYINSFSKGYDNSLRIEEYELNVKGDLKGKKAFEIIIEKNGNIKSVEYADSYDLTNTRTYFRLAHDKNSLVVYCFAKDKNHAIKIANEKRIKYIALNE
jgi:hypothetical protein